MILSIIGEESRFAPEMMEVILSSLQHTAWLDSIEDDESLSGSVQANIECEEISILDESSLPEKSKLRVPIEVVEAPLCSMTSAPSRQSEVESKQEASSAVGTDVREKGQHALNYSKNTVTATTNVLPTASDSAVATGDKSSIDIVNSGEEDNLTQLLKSCRAYRAHLQKATLTAKSGTFAPKLIQQLCESACSHLIRISAQEYVPKGGEKGGEISTPLLPQTQNSQHPTYSQPDDVPDRTGGYVLHTVVQQVYAMLGLGLHLAPDDVIAAVSEVLLTQVEEKNKKPLWQKEDNVVPIMAVLFLSGVLLPRIRALTAPASRLLFRALEIAVKKTPDLTVSLVLPMMIKIQQHSSPSLILQPHQPQHEMLLRVTRQTGCKDLLDKVVFNLSLDGQKVSRSMHDKDTPSELLLATGIAIDAMLSSAVPTDSSTMKGKSSSSTSKNSASVVTIKKGSKTTDSTPNIGDVSASDQDRLFSTWMDAVSSSSSSSSSSVHTRFTNSDLHLGAVWCSRIGLGTTHEQEGKADLDPERLKSINAILNMVMYYTSLHELE